MSHCAFRLFSVASLLAAPLLLASCAGHSASAPTKLRTSAARGPLVVLDGDMRDWPDQVVATADEHHFYLRFTIEDELYTLQSNDESTAIVLDTDASASTGAQLEPFGELASLGADLMIELAPRRDDGTPGRGVRMLALASDGTRTPVSVYDWDFSFAPTFASQWYEARISRTPAGQRLLPEAGLLSSGRIRGTVVRRDASGAIVAASDVFDATLEARCMDEVRRSTLEIPAKELGSVRVVSYNVLRSRPTQVPETYTRIFKALDADIILLQEWEATSARELAEWFNINLMREGGWDAVAAAGKVQDGAGVAVVTRFPARTLVHELRLGPTQQDPQFADDRVRYTLAHVDSPLGTLLASSIHLKSGGSASSVEDRKRIAEAELINSSIRAAAGDAKALVVGGDYNLVGSRGPLDALAKALDTDGSDAATAQPRTLGDRTYITWSEAGNVFSPGRLDYITYSDSSLRVSRSFVLDTARLSDESLAKAGLNRGDTAEASDHLPVVVDFVRP